MTTVSTANRFMSQYSPWKVTGSPTIQDLATSFPIGKRFTSAHGMRVADAPWCSSDATTGPTGGGDFTFSRMLK